MRRRTFLALFGGLNLVPVLAQAQQGVRVIGTIASGSAKPYAELIAAFREGLAQHGYVDGQGVRIESRWAEGHFDRLPALAADLVQHNAALIFGLGIGSALAAKTAAPNTPLLFLAGDDPVKFGLVQSLNRPGGMATGLAWLTSTLLAKRMEIAHELVPDSPVIHILINPKSPEAADQIDDVQRTARSAKQKIQLVNASSEQDIERAFADIGRNPHNVVVVSNDAFFASSRDRIAALAALHRVPGVYDRREYVSAGGLISYGTHYPVAYRELGVYAARILKGTKPADLPVEQPTKFELVINSKAAKALGLAIPPNMLALAEDVIE